MLFYSAKGLSSAPETSVNMDIFDEKHLCSWCDLSPACNESANKKKSVRIAKAGAYLKPMMVCIYHMVSEKKTFTPTDYEELMSPQNHTDRVVLTENNVLAYLESLGYDSTKLVKRNDN